MRILLPHRAIISTEIGESLRRFITLSPLEKTRPFLSLADWAFVFVGRTGWYTHCPLTQANSIADTAFRSTSEALSAPRHSDPVILPTISTNY